MGECSKLLGDDDGRVIRHHDAAGSYPDSASSSRNVADHNRGCSAGDTRKVMVFRNPVSAETPFLGVKG